MDSLEHRSEGEEIEGQEKECTASERRMQLFGSREGHQTGKGIGDRRPAAGAAWCPRPMVIVEYVSVEDNLWACTATVAGVATWRTG
jgi:hypothetical protein